jgi:putative nucleotidyltransferase with HDIG domain
VPTTLRIFISLLVAGNLMLFSFLAPPQNYPFSWQALLFFCLLVFLAENFCIDLPRAGAVSVTFTIILAAIILFGPSLPALAGACAALIWRDIKNGTSPYRWLFNGSQYAMAAGAAGLVYVAAGGPVLTTVSRGFVAEDFPFLLIPVVLAVTVFFLTNTVLVSTAIGLAEEMSPVGVWLVNVRWAIPHYFALAPLALAFAQIYISVGYIGMLLIVLPLIVARQTFQVYMRLRNTYLDTIRSMIAALEAKDPYTRGHSERVAMLAEKIGRRLRLSEEQVETLSFAGILHDIGKIGTSRYILRKPERLSTEEYQRIKLHPESGALILREIKFLHQVVPVIFHHHEHFDGSGYIDGIKGREIPLLARILTVADAYDAMTSPRPYRPQLSQDIACQELIACSGSQFDPVIVKAFVELIGHSPAPDPIAEGQLHLDEAPA